MNKINEYKFMKISVQGLNFNVESSVYIYTVRIKSLKKLLNNL